MARLGSRLAAITGLALCTTCAQPANHALPGPAIWDYVVEAPTADSRDVAVEATFTGARLDGLALPEEVLPYVRDLRLTSGDVEPVALAPRPGGWATSGCVARCTVRYRVDLDDLAEAVNDDVATAARVDRATLSPAGAWLIHPVPRTDVPVTVRMRGADPSTFASGMRGEGSVYAFRSPDLDEGSFTAFGPMRRFGVDIGGSHIDVAVLGGAPYAVSDDTLRRWIAGRAQLVTAFFGRFPVERATVFVVRSKGESQVAYGRVLALAGASIVLVVGDRAPPAALESDRVLLHELLHLGFPTFRGEGRWLVEGTATYYEAILRMRAGMTSRERVLQELRRHTPRGQPGVGLDERHDLESIYWGGALFCLAADVSIRARTNGGHSLDDVMRAVFAAGGDAAHVWPLREVLRVGDLATGTTVLSEMYAHHALGGERIDAEALLADIASGS
jgi:hypothetical protein